MMKLIFNDDSKCKLTLTSRELNIDGEQIAIFKDKEFKCMYSDTSSIAYTKEKIETIANGVIMINGDILKDNEAYGGTCTIFNESHDIIKIKKCRNLFDNSVVDFTVITIE